MLLIPGIMKHCIKTMMVKIMIEFDQEPDSKLHLKNAH